MINLRMKMTHHVQLMVNAYVMYHQVSKRYLIFAIGCTLFARILISIPIFSTGEGNFCRNLITGVDPTSSPSKPPSLEPTNEVSIVKVY